MKSIGVLIASIVVTSISLIVFSKASIVVASVFLFASIFVSFIYDILFSKRLYKIYVT